ncbi:hypothetical protein [Halomonas heilongjiangensis]|uniref:Uncharacterized protein n=1 Tax=Halomonas heilongjiangensis TaxID=1387883 RepID=A0A2N7TM04_9GAMM|nr:hypothetical protein [Halomonas heilongjiangensis]PMR69221.1 hypothetical protein C1H66_11615 [Halomonas heilongjiangensis]PXX87412.1 hypothetical protein CR158_18770 [Halomonas heilongjiangensis]
MWDWRYPVDDMRKEVRKARSNGDSLVAIDSIDNLLDELTSLYSRLEAEESRSPEDGSRELSEFIEDQKAVISGTYEHAKQYANVIILGGYAGLFAVWNFTRDSLEKWQVLSVGLCALISLLICITFEIYGSWLRATQVNNQVLELERLRSFISFLPTMANLKWPEFSAS